MNKIIIIGCPGSGKTTFAVKLRDKLGMPLYHLDAIWHRADRTHISREEFDLALGEILEGDLWIVDGNYSRTLERRIAACDTVILFDLPTEVCLDGAVARLGKNRPDMPWIDERLDPHLKNEIEGFKKDTLPTVYTLIDKYKEGRKTIVFNSREAADRFIDGI